MGEFQSNPGLSPDSIMRFSTNPGLPFKQVLRSPAGASQKNLLRIAKATVSSMGRGRAAPGRTVDQRATCIAPSSPSTMELAQHGWNRFTVLFHMGA